VPGFLTVKGAAEELRLAPRTVRDLIYAGRLPSVRLGRLHYLRTGDVEHERRRRLAQPLPAPRAAGRPRFAGVRPANESDRRPAGVRARPLSARRVVSEATLLARRERAVERSALRERWLRSRRHAAEPALPFSVESATGPTTCDACDRIVHSGVRVVQMAGNLAQPAAQLCLTCARRTLLAWADQRRAEAGAARRLAHTLDDKPTPNAVA
jgi:excisionase family DNA binding protein